MDIAQNKTRAHEKITEKVAGREGEKQRVEKIFNKQTSADTYAMKPASGMELCGFSGAADDDFESRGFSSRGGRGGRGGRGARD